MKIIFYFFMFRDVPGCSGIFLNVLCSGFYRRPNFSGCHTFSLTATAKIGPDTNSLTLVLVTARFWP